MELIKNQYMIKYLTLVIISLLLFGCKDDNTDTNTPKELIIRAADLSFLPEIEEEGTTFFTRSGTPRDVIDILKDNGCNTVRIRLWHTPSNPHSALPEVIELAERVKSKDLKVWLDLHYSDTWADPGKQTKPAAWESLSHSDLTDSVYSYTSKVVQLVNPDYLQIGNEINAGFLWNDGRIDNEAGFIALLNIGIQAVRDFDPEIKIIIHIAGYANASWFYGKLFSHNVDYDIIGLSYYPAWHGKCFPELITSLNMLAGGIKKDIVIAETAYPFTLEWNDWTNNLVGLTTHLMPGYPATELGQKVFLQELKNVITKCPKGIGFCYWAPDWVAFRGNTAENGSPWENMALFDFNNRALSGIEVFNP
jgi:arabinogalactan endo-1,4-beta-galactosidase